MNKKTIVFAKNFSHTLSANLVALLVSSLVILIVPKMIGIEEYGYWQLYLFYSSYVGILHFGWNDGIYLKYGGFNYDELDKKGLFSQFYALLLSQIIIGVIIIVTSQIISSDINKIFIFKIIALCTVITNVRVMLLFILQATYRIKEYATITITEKIIYFTFITLLLIFGVRQFKLLIIADVLGRIFSLLLAMYFCKDIIFRKISDFDINLNDIKTNIFSGINLMASNYISMFIIGVVRIGIEKAWDVATFGKVSLTLGASNLMMLFISAVGVVIFPVLRRVDTKKLPNIYLIIRNFLMLILYGLLILYFPVKYLLSLWLPHYSESLNYMALAFPMFIYEGKMSLLVNSYLKTLRKEKLMLRINLVSLFTSIIITIFTTVYLKNINMAIVSIVILLALKTFIAESMLSKTLHISFYRDILLESSLTIIFIASAWILDSWVTSIVYGAAYLVYIIIKKNELLRSFENLKMLMKS